MTGGDGDQRSPENPEEGVDPFEMTSEAMAISSGGRRPARTLVDPLNDADTVNKGVAPDDPNPNPGPAPARVCPSCRCKAEEGVRFCSQCGDSLATSAHAPLTAAGRCPQCAARPEQVTSSCGHCGNALHAMALVCIAADGTEGDSLAIVGVAILGRDADSDLPFPEDEYLSPRHARIDLEQGVAFVQDEGSLNGTFIRLRGPATVGPGDTIVVGRQLLRLEAVGRSEGRSKAEADGTQILGSPPPESDLVLVQLSMSGRVQDRYHLPSDGAVIGRDTGDVRFPRDRYVSGRHATLTPERGRFALNDLESSNGTWLRIRKRARLSVGDEIYLGSRVFRLKPFDSA